MNPEFNEQWKETVLARWMGEYKAGKADEPYQNNPKIILKSSQEIADDLKDFGSITADYVSATLAVNGYPIVFDGGYPKWKIKYPQQEKTYEELPE